MNTKTKLKLMLKNNINLSVVMANALLLIFISSCGSGESQKTESTDSESKKNISDLYDAPTYDPHRGEGKFTTIDLGDKLDVTMAETGQKVFEVKCNACHKLTDEKLVGPGWKGVTERRKPE